MKDKKKIRDMVTAASVIGSKSEVVRDICVDRKSRRHNIFGNDLVVLLVFFWRDRLVPILAMHFACMNSPPCILPVYT